MGGRQAQVMQVVFSNLDGDSPLVVQPEDGLRAGHVDEIDVEFVSWAQTLPSTTENEIAMSSSVRAE